ncbi:putative ribonuclease H-like domain-containing protein [Tanacetum coccineum]|uniref:Ribonuclease H-like domain-containing protein n=1 Tax=Tanacetum coccineum TaxID=301880 RepID=A0ABQ5E091_9ASTR
MKTLTRLLLSLVMMGISPKDLTSTLDIDECIDLSTPSVMYPEPVEEVKPLSSWFVKAGEMHAVPPSITGTYMPTPYKSDIEETQGKTGPAAVKFDGRQNLLKGFGRPAGWSKLRTSTVLLGDLSTDNDMVLRERHCKFGALEWLRLDIRKRHHKGHQNEFHLPDESQEETLNLRFLEDKPNDQGIGHEWYKDTDSGFRMWRTIDSEELAKLQRQEYAAKDAAARYGYLFSQETSIILSQAEAKIRNQGVSADRDPAGIASASSDPAGSNPVGSSQPAGSDPAGGNPAGSSQPAGSNEPAGKGNPAVSTSVSADFIPVHADESTLPPGQPLGSSENSTRFPFPSDVCMDPLSSGIFTSSSYDDDFSATLTNLAPVVDVNPVPTRRKYNSSSKALEDPDWVAAMQEEMQQFINQQVWKLVPLPDGKHAIGTKWILKNKRDARGIVVRNKARLVAQGHRQEEGIDYDKVYVDDIIFGSTNKAWCEEFEVLMQGEFEMSAMGEMSFFLWFYRMKQLLMLFSSAKDNLRPDIMLELVCSSTSSYSLTSHLNAVKKIFKYLKGQPKLGLWYPNDSPFQLEAYSDSDYAGSHGDRKSTTGGCQFLGRRLISWQCKKQTIVATSSTEAEYVAAASCCVQVLWIQNQLLDYGFNFMNTKIFIDNQSTICIVKNPVFHQRTKHIEIRHHFIRDANEKTLIQVLKIHTDENVADLLTKAFDGPRFEYLVVHIGMVDMVFFNLPAGCFVSAGSYGLCCWFHVHAGGHTFAGGFISADGCVFLLLHGFCLWVARSAGCIIHAAGVVYAAYTSIYAAELVCAGSIMFLLADLFLLVVTCFCCLNLVSAMLSLILPGCVLLMVDLLPAGLQNGKDVFGPTVWVHDYVATIDGREVVVTESLIRTQLHFDDTNGIFDMPNSDILEGMRAIGYPTDRALTFLKNHLSSSMEISGAHPYALKLFANMKFKWEGQPIPLTPPMLAIAAAGDDAADEECSIVSFRTHAAFAFTISLSAAAAPISPPHLLLLQAPSTQHSPRIVQPVPPPTKAREQRFQIMVVCCDRVPVNMSADCGRTHPTKVGLCSGGVWRCGGVVWLAGCEGSFLAEDAQARKRFEEEQASERLVSMRKTRDWVDLMMQVGSNPALARELLGADVTEENFIERMTALKANLVKNQWCAAHNGTITMKDVKAMNQKQLVEEYEYICRHLEKDRLLSAQYNLFRPKPAITEPPSKRQRVERASSQLDSVPTATTHTADDPDSAGSGSSNPAASATPMAGSAASNPAGCTFDDTSIDSTVPTTAALDSAGSRREIGVLPFADSADSSSPSNVLFASTSGVIADPDSDDEVFAEIIFLGKSISGDGVVFVDKLPDDEIVDPRGAKVRLLWDKPVEDFFSSESESDDDMENYIPPLPYGEFQDWEMVSCPPAIVPPLYCRDVVVAGNIIQTVQTGLRQSYECLASAPIACTARQMVFSSPWLTPKKESGSPLQTALVCFSNPLIALLFFDVATSFDSAVHRVHVVSFDAAVLDAAATVSAACIIAARIFISARCSKSFLLIMFLLVMFSFLLTEIESADLIYRLTKANQILYQGPTSGIRAFKGTLRKKNQLDKPQLLSPMILYKMSQLANDEFSQHLSDDEESNHEDASDTGNAPKQQQQVIPQTTAISNIKLPILKKEEYDIWAMEMEHYLEYIDNEVWKEGKNLLLMLFQGISEKIHGNGLMQKKIWEAIRTRFGGNANSKKMQKAVLKQQFKRDSFYQDQGAGKKEQKQNCLLTMDDGVVNWGEHTVVEER